MTTIRWLIAAGAMGFFFAYAVWGAKSRSTEPLRYEIQSIPEAAKKTDVAQPPTPSAPGSSFNAATSKLIVEPAEINLGEMAPETSRQVHALLRNAGSEPLVITAIRTTCSCGKAAADKTKLGPGETAKLEFKYNAERGRSGEEKATCIIATDEPGDPVVTLRLKVVIRRSFEQKPETVNLGDVETTGTKEISFQLRQLRGIPFQIKDIVGQGADFTFTWDKNRKLTEHVVTVKGAPQGAVGRVARTAVILTDDEWEPRVPLTIAANVVGKAFLFQPGTVLPLHEDGTLPPFGIDIYPADPQFAGPLNILSVQDENDRPTKFRLEKGLRNGVRLIVAVTGRWSEDAPPKGALLIQTDLEPLPLRFSYQSVPTMRVLKPGYRGYKSPPPESPAKTTQRTGADRP
jgi:hypothetical protein